MILSLFRRQIGMTVSQSVLCRFRDRVIVSGALAGAIVWGYHCPTLRAAPGACVGLRLSRTPCDVATRRIHYKYLLIWILCDIMIVSHFMRYRFATGLYCRTMTTSASKRHHIGPLQGCLIIQNPFRCGRLPKRR